MDLQGLVYQYFCSTGGYTPESTAVFAITLIVFVYIIYKILNKLKVKFDKRLGLAISPYIVLGSSVRVLKDAGILTSCIFQTPGIYFLIFSITFFVLIMSIILERKKGITYFKTMFVIGLILMSPVLGILKYRNFMGVGYVLLWFVPWLIILKAIPWLTENKVITGVHMFDATNTFVSLNYFGYYEQHVLPRYIIEFFGTSFSFIVLKFVVIVSLLLLIDNFSDDREFNNYIKLIIGILGAATGTRDFLRLFYLT